LVPGLRQKLFYNSSKGQNARVAATDAKEFAMGVEGGWWNDAEKRRARELLPIIQEVLQKA